MEAGEGNVLGSNLLLQKDVCWTVDSPVVDRDHRAQHGHDAGGSYRSPHYHYVAALRDYLSEVPTFSQSKGW
eukprot:747491-Hanusia_phi.AAC.1